MFQMKKTAIQKFLEAADAYANATGHRVQIKIRPQRHQRKTDALHDIDINNPATTAAVRRFVKEKKS